jgi:hypothetical protein
MRIVIAIFASCALVIVLLSAIALDHASVVMASILLALICVSVFFCTAAGYRHSVRIGQLSIALLVSLLVIASVAGTGWPLVTLFRASQESIEEVARLVEQGQQIRTPTRIGLFNIVKIETVGGTVCLWTSISGDKDGFVKTSTVGIQRFNVWSTLELDKDWQFFWED